MIFGFNTDVKHADIVYHVQSEAQHSDRLLQTHVFVGGQCRGKCELVLSCAPTLPGFGESGFEPGLTDPQEMLRLQHRQVIEAIRDGHIDCLFSPAELNLQWFDATADPDGCGAALRFRLTASNIPLSPAYLLGRLEAAQQGPMFARAETTAEGTGSLRFSVQREAMTESTIVIEAFHAGRRGCWRFLLQTRQPIASATVAPMF